MIARNNFTPIVGRIISSGFNVFASGWVSRSAGLKGSGHPTRRVHSFQYGDMDYTFSLPQNAATESGNSGTEMVLGERFAPGRFALTKANTFPHNELPASRRSDGVRDHPGLAFRFPSE